MGNGKESLKGKGIELEALTYVEFEFQREKTVCGRGTIQTEKVSELLKDVHP